MGEAVSYTDFFVIATGANAAADACHRRRDPARSSTSVTFVRRVSRASPKATGSSSTTSMSSCTSSRRRRATSIVSRRCGATCPRVAVPDDGRGRELTGRAVASRRVARLGGPQRSPVGPSPQEPAADAAKHEKTTRQEKGGSHETCQVRPRDARRARGHARPRVATALPQRRRSTPSEHQLLRADQQRARRIAVWRRLRVNSRHW